MAAAFRPRFLRRSAESAGGDPGGEPGVEGGDPGGEPGVEGGDLGERGDTGEGPGDDGGEWLAYELHEWTLESRVMLQQLLTVDQVVHSWQGTTLMVHESLEEKVDGLVEEVEEAEQAREAIARPIGPDDDLTAFEIGDWSPEMRDELVERLVQAKVPHILEQSASGGEAGVDGGGRVDGVQDGGDGGEAGAGWDLWVRETDEERVDLVIDDMLVRLEEANFVELDGLEVNDLLSDLFVACDRLRRDPGDPDGITGAVSGARRIAGVRTPFGFSAPSWRGLRNAAGELLSLVEGEDTDSEELRDLARRLSDTLRTLI